MKVSNGRNGCYSIVYLVCEALNFVNVIGQMFLLDRFFGGAFIEYGLKVSVGRREFVRLTLRRTMQGMGIAVMMRGMMIQ